MAAEEIIQLLDLYWFEREVFSRKPGSVVQETKPVVEIQEQVEEPKFSRLSSLHVRSLSDQILSSKASFCSDSESISPNSTLQTLKLQTIYSGKEVGEFASQSVKQEETETEPTGTTKPTKPEVTERKRRRRRRRKESKSLSDLEFEELKGFMDLGFVFSEEDKDSSLVSIIPGLQRLKKVDQEPINEQMVSRPYLSEAWEVLDHQRKVENPLMNWRVPALGNEVSMKDHLRFWAHTVASTVR